MPYKKIGIIGGLSPESTVSYYLHITRSYVRQYHRDSYPEIVIYSVNLDQYHGWRALGRWDLIAADLTEITRKLHAAGAEIGLIATNTMHKVFDEVQSRSPLPLIHILEPTIAEIKSHGIQRVGVLGTKFTMSEPFYKQRLVEQNIVPIVPDAADQEKIHSVIVDELVRGILTESSKAYYLQVVEKLVAEGAQGIILGCTEIPLLIKQGDCQVRLFDTATLHAEAALQLAIS